MDTSPITEQNLPLTGSLAINQDMLSSVFAGCSDVVFHPFQTACHTSAVCIYCVGLCDTERLERQVLTPLQEMGINAAQVPLASVKSVETTTQAVQAILEGKLYYCWKVHELELHTRCTKLKIVQLRNR